LAAEVRSPAASVEPSQAPASPPAKTAKQAARKPTKSGPNIFRKALKPIWPLSKRDKPAPADR
jgi:hypothetical protein